MEVVKVKNITYAKYEEVLLRRDSLQKEAEQYHQEYIRIFGDLILESYSLKVECIKKKKMITYCQLQINRGRSISQVELTAYIEKEMMEYEAELRSMAMDVKLAKNAEKISPAEVHRIKKIYHALVKLIHPDMHPELAEDEIIKDYWQRIVIAYRHNQLKEMEELDLLVRSYLDDKGIRPQDINVEGIEEKIKAVEEQIEKILTTNPYLCKLILDDEEESRSVKQSYKDEIEAFKKYSAQLDDVLAAFEVKEMLS